MSSSDSHVLTIKCSHLQLSTVFNVVSLSTQIQLNVLRLSDRGAQFLKRNPLCSKNRIPIH